MSIHQFPRTEFDLPMEVLGVLMRDPHHFGSLGGIRDEIEDQHGRTFADEQIEEALEQLQRLGWEIVEHYSDDGHGYELIVGGNAA